MKPRQLWKVATYAELFYFVINSSSPVIFQQEPSFIHTNSNTQIAKGDYKKKSLKSAEEER